MTKFFGGKVFQVAAGTIFLSLGVLSVDSFGSSIPYAILMPILAIFAMIPQMYVYTLYKKETLLRYNTNSPLFFFFKSRKKVYFIIFLFTFCTPFLTCVKIRMFSYYEMLILLLLPFVYILAEKAVKAIVNKIYKEGYVEYRTFIFRIVASVIMGIIYPVAVYYLYDYIAAFKPPVFSPDENPIAWEITDILKFQDKLMDIAKSAAGLFIPGNIMKIITVFLSGSISFYFIINLYAFFGLKANQIADVFRNIKGEKMSVKRLVVILLAAAIFFSAYSYLYYRRCATLMDKNRQTEIQAEMEKKIEDAKKMADSAYNIAMASIDQIKSKYDKNLLNIVGQYYDNANNRIDKFLDWYYSWGIKIFKGVGNVLDMFGLGGDVKKHLTEAIVKYLIPESQIAYNIANKVNLAKVKMTEEINDIIKKSGVHFDLGEFDLNLSGNDLENELLYKITHSSIFNEAQGFGQGVRSRDDFRRGLQQIIKELKEEQINRVSSALDDYKRSIKKIPERRF